MSHNFEQSIKCLDTIVHKGHNASKTKNANKRKMKYKNNGSAHLALIKHKLFRSESKITAGQS